ncbi:MAG: Dihydroneopterin aldolase [Alphaproteobacteria bacterium]|nr:MAG: Dihydroneopterin aldolase [Alphaproteobacteria bacterium]
MNQQTPDSRPDLANAARGLRHVFVNRLAVAASIGIHPHERENKQTIWLTIDAGVLEDDATPEAIGDVVCYEDICKVATALAGEGHIDLVETLAERIADRLMQDPRLVQIRVQIEKPEAIDEAASVGIAISRLRG